MPVAAPRSQLNVACAISDLLDGALAWFEGNLAYFDPIGADARPDPLRNKAFAELAFFCDYFRRARPDAREKVGRMLRFVASVWSRAEYHDLVVRNPESLQLYVLTYDSLLHSGFDVSASAEVIQRVIDAGYATAVEAVPFRVMDFRHVLDYGQFRHALPSMLTLFTQTMLRSRPPAHYFTKADIYCFTHTLFYVTDFGFLRSTCMTAEELSSYQSQVEQLLGLYIRLADWDLTAELLICAHCLQCSRTIITEAAWTALTQAQLREGLVPAPGYAPPTGEMTESSERVFEQNYHTTLVAALAAALH